MGSSTSWILDSGGAGRGAWQGGVLCELMRWPRQHGGYPSVMMGASAGGYAAADVATGTEATVLKGWTAWGADDIPERYPLAPFVAGEWPRSLLVFTSRVRRRDRRALRQADLAKLFAMAATRKLPRPLKYLPGYQVDPVVFATNLPDTLHSEFVRPLTRHNYHCVIEASCLVPLAMGPPLARLALSRPPGCWRRRDGLRRRGLCFEDADGGFRHRPPFSRPRPPGRYAQHRHLLLRPEGASLGDEHATPRAE